MADWRATHGGERWGADAAARALFEDGNEVGDRELVFRAADLRLDLDQRRQVDDANFDVLIAHRLGVLHELFVTLPGGELAQRIEPSDVVRLSCPVPESCSAVGRRCRFARS